MEYNERFKVVMVATRKALVSHDDRQVIINDVINQWKSGLVATDGIVSGIGLYDTEKREMVNLQF